MSLYCKKHNEEIKIRSISYPSYNILVVAGECEKCESDCIITSEKPILTEKEKENLLLKSFPERLTPVKKDSDEYDSYEDTQEHINKVRGNLEKICKNLEQRGKVHDKSKLEDPEKPLFDKYTPILEGLAYGSMEYKQSLDALKPALDHHYAKNDHHPQYFENGVDDMDLCQLVEMFCDWKAATERTKDGDINKSIDINQERFKLDPQLVKIFKNSIKLLK